MELTDKRIIRELLKKYNAKPEKYLGQHFILSKRALNLIISAAEINPDAQRGRGSNPDARSGSQSRRRLRKRRRKTDIIVEIGSGLGTLTNEIAKTGAKVIAIEKDALMVEILKETLAGYKNVKIIQSDARKIKLPTTGVGLRLKRGKGGDKYKIVANLPYNVATFLIRQWLESENPPDLMVLMIQKEVAQRIYAKSPHANLLGISVQFYADVEIVDYVKKESFWPRPKVDAAIIKIIPKKTPPQKTQKAFFAALKAGFSQPRKQLARNLAKKLKISKENIISALKKLDISEQARAENLTLEQWISLATSLHFTTLKGNNRLISRSL